MFGLTVKAIAFRNIRRWMDGRVGAPRSHTGGPTPTAGEEKQGRFHSCLSHIRCREESRECCRQIKRDSFTAHDDVGIVFRSKRKLNKNKQTKILVEMHFVVYSNFSSLDPTSSRS